MPEVPKFTDEQYSGQPEEIQEDILEDKKQPLNWKSEIPKWFIEAESEWEKLWDKDTHHFYEHEKDYEEMIEYLKDLIQYIRDNEFDEVVLLDKSARPIATMIRTAWNFEAEDSPMPHISFANIGREKSVDAYESYSSFDSFFPVMEYDYDIEEVDNFTEDELREKVLGTEDPDYFKKVHETYTEDGHKKSIYDGKKVLIVDELRGRGRSLTLAKRIFDISFQNEADSIESYYFYDKTRKHSDGKEAQAMFNEEMPWSRHSEQGSTGVVDNQAPKEFLTTPVKSTERRINDLKKLYFDDLNEWVAKNDTSEIREAISGVLADPKIRIHEYKMDKYQDRLFDAVASFRSFAQDLLDFLDGTRSPDPKNTDQLIDKFREALAVESIKDYLHGMWRDCGMDWDKWNIVSEYFEPFIKILNSFSQPLQEHGFDPWAMNDDTDYRQEAVKNRKMLKFAVLNHYFKSGWGWEQKFTPTKYLGPNIKQLSFLQDKEHFADLITD